MQQWILIFSLPQSLDDREIITPNYMTQSPVSTQKKIEHKGIAKICKRNIFFFRKKATKKYVPSLMLYAKLTYKKKDEQVNIDLFSKTKGLLSLHVH